MVTEPRRVRLCIGAVSCSRRSSGCGAKCRACRRVSASRDSRVRLSSWLASRTSCTCSQHHWTKSSWFCRTSSAPSPAAALDLGSRLSSRSQRGWSAGTVCWRTGYAP